MSRTPQIDGRAAYGATGIPRPKRRDIECVIVISDGDDEGQATTPKSQSETSLSETAPLTSASQPLIPVDTDVPASFSTPEAVSEQKEAPRIVDPHADAISLLSSDEDGDDDSDNEIEYDYISSDDSAILQSAFARSALQSGSWSDGATATRTHVKMPRMSHQNKQHNERKPSKREKRFAKQQRQPVRVKSKRRRLSSASTTTRSQTQSLPQPVPAGPVELRCTNGLDTITIHRSHSLAGISHVILVDLDNWRHLFLRMPFALSSDCFVSAFASVDTVRTLRVPDDAAIINNSDSISDSDLAALSPFTRLLAAHRIQFTVSGCSANAADFCMSFVMGVLHASLPLHVPFTVLSGDRGLEESARLVAMHGRESRRVDPHSLIVPGDSQQTDQLILTALSSILQR